MVTVTAAEAAGAAVSPSQEAVCLMALCLLGPNGLPPVPCIRILVPTPQVSVHAPQLLSVSLRGSPGLCLTATFPSLLSC